MCFSTSLYGNTCSLMHLLRLQGGGYIPTPLNPPYILYESVHKNILLSFLITILLAVVYVICGLWYSFSLTCLSGSYIRTKGILVIMIIILTILLNNHSVKTTVNRGAKVTFSVFTANYACVSKHLINWQKTAHVATSYMLNF